MDINNKIIEEIIFSQFNEYPSEIEKIEMGVMTFKFRVKVNNINYVLRIYPPENTTNIEQEFEMMQKLFAASCKVPEPVIFSEKLNERFLIYKFIEGKPLSFLLPSLDEVEINAIADEIIDNVLHISSQEVEGFGFSFLSSKKYDSWREFLQEYIDRGNFHLRENKLFDEFTIESILGFAKKQIKQINIERPRFIWCDFSQGNIIINKNKLAGFVDFEGCVFGDPVIALGYLFAIEGNSKFFDAIINCYRKHANVDYERILFYAIVRLLRFSKYVNNPFPTGIKRDPVPDYFKGLPIAIEYIKSKNKNG